MCGIAGFYHHHKEPERVLRRMLQAIRHRGPEESGQLVVDKMGIGNTRLSIVDVEGGRQPIANEDNVIHVVCNGEIYNAPQLRKELQESGHVFRTKSDTETILHLYEDSGTDCFKRLNGMFSVCILDGKKNTIYVARDRFGVKPLYYSTNDVGFHFASEIKSILTVPGFKKDIDHEALGIFLALFYVPDPWSIFKNIRKLRPGHFIEVNDEGAAEYCYYDLDFTHKIDVTREDAQQEVYRLLSNSVERQVMADVPVGVLLSGGMDSKAVCALAQKVLGDTTAFTIRFDEALFDEGNSAKHWASALNVKHESITFTMPELKDELIGRMKALDEPYALWCNVATASLSRYIHHNDFKVVLSGEGGDELFCGYPTLHAANLGCVYTLFPKFIRTLLKKVVFMLPAGKGRLPYSFMLKSFFGSDFSSITRAFFGFKEVVRKESWGSLLSENAYASLQGVDPYIAFAQYEDKIKGLGRIDALSYLDFKVFLPGCSFAGNDNAYMSSSVESRVPFMDNELVDYVVSLPEKIRFHPLKPKELLKSIQRKYLATDFPQLGKELDKPYRKAGFEIPIQDWLRIPVYQDFVRGLLDRENIERVGFFDPGRVEEILSEQLADKQNHERVIQVITCLQIFFDSHEISWG